ncbi:MAG TPA: hypothetical protein VL403_16235, partial [Candidatus Kryptonia bacterium]|nr:hypothetical protein [Candidatus Kryptonia bacterium]
TATPSPTPTRTVVCTPPRCQTGEVVFCPGTCPGGCGTQCATPTPPPPLGACVGDCDDDGHVQVDELVKGVNIALGTLDFSTCPAFDTDMNFHVTVDELVKAVNAALNGCVRSTRTPTPIDQNPSPSQTITCGCTPTTTATFTPSITPTSLAHPGDLARSIAGRAALIADGMGAVPSVVTALAAGFVFDTGNTPGTSASRRSSDLGGIAAACPLGGTVTRTCTPGADQNVVMAISFSSCTVSTPDGYGTFNGSMTLTGNGFCPNLIVPPFEIAIDFSGSFSDSQHQVKLNLDANVDGTVTLAQLAGSCFLSGATFTLNGTLDAAIPAGGGVRVEFQNTAIDAVVNEFSGDCAPLRFAATFNGNAGFTEIASQASFNVSFADFLFNQDANPKLIQLNGGLSSGCLGGAVTLATDTPLIGQLGALCFTSGRLRATTTQTAEAVSYVAGGGVAIDSNLDEVPEQTFDSCVMSPLLECSGG